MTDQCVSLVAQLCPTLWLHGLWPNRFLCPWGSLDKDTWVGCHFLLQGIFPSQESNQCLPYLLHCRRILYYWATREAWLINKHMERCLTSLVFSEMQIKSTVSNYLPARIKLERLTIPNIVEDNQLTIRFITRECKVTHPLW